MVQSHRDVLSMPFVADHLLAYIGVNRFLIDSCMCVCRVWRDKAKQMLNKRDLLVIPFANKPETMAGDFQCFVDGPCCFVEVLDPLMQKWFRLPTLLHEMSEPRPVLLQSKLTIVSYQRIYSYGRLCTHTHTHTQAGRQMFTSCVADAPRGEWNLLTQMPVPYTAMDNFKCCVLGGDKLIVIGGRAHYNLQRRLKPTLCYDANTASWSTFDVAPTRSQVAVNVGNDANGLCKGVVVFAGGLDDDPPQPEAVHGHARLDVESGTWTPMQTIEMSGVLVKAACRWRDHIVCFTDKCEDGYHDVICLDCETLSISRKLSLPRLRGSVEVMDPGDYESVSLVCCVVLNDVLYVFQRWPPLETREYACIDHVISWYNAADNRWHTNDKKMTATDDVFIPLEDLAPESHHLKFDSYVNYGFMYSWTGAMPLAVLGKPLPNLAGHVMCSRFDMESSDDEEEEQ